MFELLQHELWKNVSLSQKIINCSFFFVVSRLIFQAPHFCKSCFATERQHKVSLHFFLREKKIFPVMFASNGTLKNAWCTCARAKKNMSEINMQKQVDCIGGTLVARGEIYSTNKAFLFSLRVREMSSQNYRSLFRKTRQICQAARDWNFLPACMYVSTELQHLKWFASSFL